VVTGLDPDVPELALQERVNVKNVEFNTVIDTFSISKLDRDPFLGTITKKKTNVSTKPKRKPLAWQPVDYLGVIKTTHKKSRVFIVSINGKQYLLKRGQVKDSVTLLSGNDKSILLSYKGEQKKVSRKKQ
jgi:hypothetical protein